MHVKLLWLAMKGHSLWERYAKAKYSRGNSFIVTGPRVSPLWTSIVAHYSLLNMNTRWILGRGDLSFWGDNWIGTQLIGPQPLDMNITVREGLNIMHQFDQLIPLETKHKIHGVVLDPNKEDRLVFTLADNGKF